ncbi:13843_t:CDS:2, partial [Entrophospora sp. SA101]
KRLTLKDDKVFIFGIKNVKERARVVNGLVRSGPKAISLIKGPDRWTGLRPRSGLQWNSTYLMIKRFIEKRSIIECLVNNNYGELQELCLTTSNWMHIGKPMYEAVKLSSSSSYPTMGDVRLAFIGNNITDEIIQELQNIISNYSRQENSDHKYSNSAPHETEYPISSKIAIDYLVIQSTGVPAEGTFSIAGLTIGKLRNKLLSDTARATICLKSWISEGDNE